MLEIKNLTKIYKGGKEAVSDLSLKVNAGDICAFIGHNGAGKTSTIKCVVGIHDFNKGEIYVDGMSVKEKPAYKENADHKGNIIISNHSKSQAYCIHSAVLILHKLIKTNQNQWKH